VKEGEQKRVQVKKATLVLEERGEGWIEKEKPAANIGHRIFQHKGKQGAT